MRKEKVDTQKELLKKIFARLVETNIEIMKFQITLTKKEDEIKGLRKLIKTSEKAIEIINSINHYEILVSLYNTFVNKKEFYFISIMHNIVNKNTIVKWDRSEKGFKQFLKLESEAQELAKKEQEEKVKEQEFIRKAKEEGKKVEMIYKDGKIKPIIVEEPLN